MKHHAFIFSAFFIGVALFPPPDLSQQSARPEEPNPRHLEEVVLDPKTGSLYLFGGVELQNQKWIEPDNLYEFKSGWTERREKGPCGRRGHAMVYNPRAAAIFIIGGVTQVGSQDSVLLDVWQLTGKKWTRLETLCPVKEARAVYDEASKSILVYGDAYNLGKAWDGGDARKFELWSFDGKHWTKLGDNGPADGPFPIAYNRHEKALSLLAWKSKDQVLLWQWKNNRWTKTEFDTDIPPLRTKYAMCYANDMNALFLYGGLDADRNLLGDFWKLEGGRWTKIQTDLSPAPKASLRLLDGGDKLFLYGGLKKEGLTNELWVFANNNWKRQ